MRLPTLSSSLLLLCATPALAQGLTLDKVGGAIGGSVDFPIHGDAGEPYALVLDLMEQQTVLPALGITLDITDQFAWVTFNTPTFMGVLDTSGNATASTVLPNDPSIQDCIFSLQAIGGSSPFRTSNLIRITPQLQGTFRPSLSSPPLPILGGGVVATGNSELLFVGGSGPAATRYESRLEEWSLDGTTFGVGLLAQTTELADGRVLFTGGLDLTTGQPSAAAAIYDPATQTTTSLTMASARAGHGASQMGNGIVLITGGLLTFDLADPLSLFTGIQNTTEFFDPATETFTAGPIMLEARALHTSTTLTNGQVLIAGGISVLPIVNLPTVSPTAYLFNPSIGNFGLPSIFTGPRMLHTATALSNGQVLIAGGLSLDLTAFLASGNIEDLVIGTREDCLVYTPGFFSGSFAVVPGMQVGRAGAAIAALPNGGALIAGGFQLTIDIANNNITAAATETADVFSSSLNSISPTGSMAAARLFPVSTNLPDGTIMIVGGGPLNAEIYQH